MENKEKAFELRSLEADDMFPMFQIVSKIGIKEFKSCFESATVQEAIGKLAAEKKNDKSAVAAIGMMVGMDIIGVLMANIGNAKEDIYSLLSSLSGMKRDEIAKMPPKTFMEMVMAVVKKEEFVDFFQGVSELLK